MMSYLTTGRRMRTNNVSRLTYVYPYYLCCVDVRAGHYCVVTFVSGY